MGFIATILGLGTLWLGNVALLKVVEGDTKETKRLAFSLSFIAIGLLGFFWAGMLLHSPVDGSVDVILAILYCVFLSIPYFVATSNFVGIIMRIGEESGII
jgi:cell division protein FtsX